MTALGQVLHSHPKPVDHVLIGEQLVEGSALQSLWMHTESKCGTVKFAVTDLIEDNTQSIIHKNGTDAPLELLPSFSGELEVKKYIHTLTQIAGPRSWHAHCNIFSHIWSGCYSEYHWLYKVRLVLVCQRTETTGAEPVVHFMIA